MDLMNGGLSWASVRRIADDLSDTGEEEVSLNGDGAVDVGDVTTLVAAVLSGNAPATFDLNGDSTVDVGDVTLLVSAVLSGK